MLRITSAVAVGMALLLGLPGRASAQLTITPDPAPYSFGKGANQQSGSIDFLLVSATNLDMTLTRTQGQPVAIAVLVIDQSLTDVREVVTTAWIPGPDNDIFRDFISTDIGFFEFDAWQAAETTSDLVSLGFTTDPLAAGDQIFIGILGLGQGGAFQLLHIVTATVGP